MEVQGCDYDVVTDEDLHREGADLLASYKVVVTGTHPEYWTEQMLDGLEGYLADGGRLMYLGGNGFYWITSFDPERPHVIEIRRWGGTGPWKAQPGEYIGQRAVALFAHHVFVRRQPPKRAGHQRRGDDGLA